MRNLKIRLKMLCCFGLVLVLLTVMTGFSLGNLRRISNMVSELYETKYADSLTTVKLSRELYRMDGMVMDMVIDGSADGYESEYAQVRESVDQDLKEIVNSVGTGSNIIAVQDAINRLDVAYATVVQSLRAGASERAARVSDEYATIMDKAVDAAAQLSADADAGAVDFMDRANRIADQVILFQDILFVVIFLLCIGAALWLSAGVSRPVKKLAAGMEQIAEGHLDTCVENSNGDELGTLTRKLNGTMGLLRDYVYDISSVLGEIGSGNISLEVAREYIGDFGEIKRSLNQIIASLNGTLSQIRTCCREVRSGSSSLANSAQSLTQGAAEQSAALDEFQGSLNRVAELTAQDAKNAAQIQHLSGQAAEVAMASDGQMRQMTDSMREIDDSSQEIAKVIKIIEDIAFQTNILALNAAVEAARAGAAGKGFAVVADEVRNLASKSAEAAKNTTAMISKALHAVEGGRKNVDASADTMRQVKDCVEQMARLLEDIDKSTAEQATAFALMTETAGQISAVVHTNSAAAEENSAASEQLLGQAEALEALVERFRLKEDSHAGGPFQK